METATKVRTLSDVIDEALRLIDEQGLNPVDAAGRLLDVQLPHDEEREVKRAGLARKIRKAKRERIRSGTRSGKTQTSGTSRGDVDIPGREAGLETEAQLILWQVQLPGADREDGQLHLPEFSHEDFLAALERRVEEPRQRADREEPLWKKGAAVTEAYDTLADAPLEAKREVANLVLEAQLVDPGDIEV